MKHIDVSMTQRLHSGVSHCELAADERRNSFIVDLRRHFEIDAS